MSVKCPFITNLVIGKAKKENHIRKVRKSKERKVKNIGKDPIIFSKTHFKYDLNCRLFVDVCKLGC